MKYRVLRQKVSTRGGGIEIDLTPFGFEGHRMSAYQNYLGGGMLGAIKANDTIRSQVTNVRLQLKWSNRFKELDEIAEGLMQHFHSLTNHEDDEWESATFEENQQRPTSAY
jgi:hypothetical protein